MLQASEKAGSLVRVVCNLVWTSDQWVRIHVVEVGELNN